LILVLVLVFEFLDFEFWALGFWTLGFDFRALHAYTQGPHGAALSAILLVLPTWPMPLRGAAPIANANVVKQSLIYWQPAGEKYLKKMSN
jgi:hypothetical protein